MIRKVISSFGSITIIRILSRVCQFIIKTYLIRNLLDKEIVGHMLQLDLIIAVSLHLVKSCLKPAYQKVSNNQNLEKNIISGMNLLNIGVIITAVVSCTVSFFQLRHYENLQPSKRLHNLNFSILFYCLAAISEAMFQKYNVRNVLEYNYLKSALIEMGSFLPKTILIFIAVQLGWFQTMGILVFGIGHFIYSSLLFLISFLMAKKQNITLLPVIIEGQGDGISRYYIDSKTKQSAKEFFFLSLIKLGIQQFQKIALVALDISSFSSIYTLVSNLGSIVVRYIFAPLQQVAFNYFSRGQEKQCVHTLITITKSITIFSFLSLSYGYNFSEPFLGFLYGEKWVQRDSIRALQIYTVLLSFLGINGMMEAFLFAKAGREFKNYKYASMIPTAVYIASSFLFLQYTSLGTSSFFLANSLSMIIRIAISWNLQIKKHISLLDFIVSIKPSKKFLLSVGLTFLVGNPETPFVGLCRFNSYFKDMILGGFLFIINIAVIIFQNKQFIKEKFFNIQIKNYKKQ